MGVTTVHLLERRNPTTDYEKAVQKVESVMAKGKGEMGFPLEESQTKQQQAEDIRKLRERLDNKRADTVDPDQTVRR